MLRHIVFFRFQAEAAGQDAATNARQLKLMLGGLPAQIKDLQSLEAGLDVIRSPRSWDLALVTTFADRDALQRYQVHPAHQEVVAFVRQVTSEVAAVDFEF